MGADQGWFESDEDYQRRVAQEANQRTIEDASGSAPSQGWFESDHDYRERLTREASEHRIAESTGSPPSQGWFEGESEYQDRIEREANDRTVQDSTGSAPSQGWFESDHDYEVRVRKEANESIVERGKGSQPSQGWFEGDHDYRSRVAHEARQVRARGLPTAQSQNNGLSGRNTDSGGSYGSSTAPSSSGSGGVLFVGVAITVVVFTVLASLRSPSDNKATSLVPKDIPAQPPISNTTRSTGSQKVPATASSFVGRWDGTWGPDQVREVLILTQESSAEFAGTSFFETRDGVAFSAGRGVVRGTISGGRVEFSLSRDGETFRWFGDVDDYYRVLNGTFAGYANIATYTRH